MTTVTLETDEGNELPEGLRELAQMMLESEGGSKSETKAPKAARKVSDVKTRTRLYDKYGRFVLVPTTFIERGVNLTAKAKVMFLVLRSFTNEETDKTFPAYPAIMARAGRGFNRREDVADALGELVEFGWLQRKRNFGKSNDYCLTKPPRLSPTQEEADRWEAAIRARNQERRGNTGLSFEGVRRSPRTGGQSVVPHGWTTDSATRVDTN
jgi:hypothetical protein